MKRDKRQKGINRLCRTNLMDVDKISCVNVLHFGSFKLIKIVKIIEHDDLKCDVTCAKGAVKV